MWKRIKIKTTAFVCAVKMRLDDDANKLHRMWSTWIAGGGLIGLPAAWLYLPPDIRAEFPGWSKIAAGIVLFAVYLLAKAWRQNGLVRNGD